MDDSKHEISAVLLCYISIGKCEDEAVTGLFVLSIWCIFFIVLNQVTYEHYRMKYDGAGI